MPSIPVLTVVAIVVILLICLIQFARHSLDWSQGPKDFDVAPTVLTMIEEATYVANHFTGHTMANGERHYSQSFTAAVNADIAPLGAWLEVCTVEQPKNRVFVRVTDRKPGSGIDLSQRAFRLLAPLERGRVLVEVTVR